MSIVSQIINVLISIALDDIAAELAKDLGQQNKGGTRERSQQIRSIEQTRR